ncbi:hypothetical protein IOQ59_14925 [Pontibacterium sp. N1Y112]|uniref:DUF3568 family protein n=1 Tax=Pontibacterium sinense TaxID=2781979 RepID=A0A8J7FLR2_9GAMM|nr:DUF3568 family protein [Pontibacterium sinense]MBE9398548.1 hypothetical protein [Pontibacterium sinense]
MSRSVRRFILPLILSVFTLTGCEPVSMTLFGVGTATGVGYTLNGYAHKTFTAPVSGVRSAAKTALRRMDIKIEDRQVTDEGETIIAKAAGWKIEIFLEPISSKTTRMRSVAKKDLQVDRATAAEIIAQTEIALIGRG